MSESCYWLVQLISLVQIEKAACVTFPLGTVKVTHWTGAVIKIEILAQDCGHAAAKPLSWQVAVHKG
ncbi:hypothetical protein [Brenneria tiliae]|uniref:hypothetical protein n=1 Tax=Brenneria tiliae TaxID=2914984 RepID=UPI002014B9D5|nr:hypothetical protein [Brenneria tiliae]MCL2895916.1 hypothetical protein [Brenneria tiliae]MCL2902757.1 hypothetical protein [Brenneria tiliae]